MKAIESACMFVRQSFNNRKTKTETYLACVLALSGRLANTEPTPTHETKRNASSRKQYCLPTERKYWLLIHVNS